MGCPAMDVRSQVSDRVEEINMLEVSRILAAAGATLAGVAFTVYGIAHSIRGDAG